MRSTGCYESTLISVYLFDQLEKTKLLQATATPAPVSTENVSGMNTPLAIDLLGQNKKLSKTENGQHHTMSEWILSDTKWQFSLIVRLQQKHSLRKEKQFVDDKSNDWWNKLLCLASLATNLEIFVAEPPGPWILPGYMKVELAVMEPMWVSPLPSFSVSPGWWKQCRQGHPDGN